MAECYFQILLYSLSISFCLLFPQTISLNFDLTNLLDQDQKFKTFGTASFSSQGLELTSNKTTSDSDYESGGAAFVEPLHLWDKTTRTLADFNTSFVFVVNSEGEKIWDDFRFFLSPQGLDLSSTDFSSLVTVEFNAAENRNVTINVRSYTANVAAGWAGDTANGKENRAWISYNSTSQSLGVVFTGSTNTSAVPDSISFIVDLRDHLPDWVTVGFYGRGWYSSTYFTTNTVKSWEFSSNLELNQTNITAVPVPAPTAASKPFSVGAVVGGSLGGFSVFLGVLYLLYTYKDPVGQALINIAKATNCIGLCLLNETGRDTGSKTSGGADPPKTAGGADPSNTPGGADPSNTPGESTASTVPSKDQNVVVSTVIDVP